jgi:hypothetical protein
MGAKFKISVEIINDDGSRTIEPITVEKEIPTLDEFMIGQNFRQNFDTYERAVLKARKEVVENATSEYLEAASKKNSMIGKKSPKEKKT